MRERGRIEQWRRRHSAAPPITSSPGRHLSKLVADARFKLTDLRDAGEPVSSETDVAVAVREDKADAGLAIAAAAREQGLDFVPLQWERFDLVVQHVEYFEPPLQRLLAFTRTKAFQDRATRFGGYGVNNTGTIMFNARR